MPSAGLTEIVVSRGPRDKDRLVGKPDEPMADAPGKQTTNTRESTRTDDN